MDAVIQDTRQRYSFVSSPGVMVLPLSEIKIEVMSRPVTYAGRRRRDTAHIKTTIQQAAPLLVEVVNVQLALIFLESSSSFSSSTSSSKNQKTQKNQKRIISPDDVKNHITALIKSLAQKEVLAGAVSYTHLRAHETVLDLVCRLLLEKKKKIKKNNKINH
eukprot:TRINITY_DN17898_c0_g2_i1.p1 TRINITY_DN17898_c0_g2~~TRINITY_DN17898_c0_g2_i1.p1  ORF type:complete len:161 (+),score=5.92 TRINITY_DN17898_c0_g2_i1:129-611(+)